jgi:hypothetical protein
MTVPKNSLPSDTELPQGPGFFLYPRRDTERYFPDPFSYFSASRLDREIRCMNTAIIVDLQGLSVIPQIYQTLFYRTREFAATVRKLVDAAPASWAEAACLLVEWSVNVLRHKEVGLERFLHSQRESLYWILDDALLTICVDQWDPQSTTQPSSHSTQSGTSSSSMPKPVPWDISTAPITLSLSKAQDLRPMWVARDLKEREKWDLISLDPQGLYSDAGWFRRSKQFLHESNRIHEIWRTMRRWGGGELPAELANAIVEDVATFENLPMGNLRAHYFSKKR